MLIPEDRVDEMQWIRGEVAAGRSVENFETVRVRKDGHQIEVSMTISPVRDATARVIGFSAIARDITERKRAEQELNETREETERLERLVDDLLLVARLDAGTFTVEASDVDLQRIVANCVEAAQPAAEDKDIELTLDTETVGSCSGDSHRLEQLLDNLISNALKYTPEGGRVETRLQRQNGHVSIEVQDSGIGIPADEQKYLFDQFFRASTAKSGAIPGVGLGLTIVKAIAEAHRGRVEVESEQGRGTIFRVELPVAPVI